MIMEAKGVMIRNELVGADLKRNIEEKLNFDYDKLKDTMNVK